MNTIRRLSSGYLHLCLMLCLLTAVSPSIAAAPLPGAKQQNVTLANGTEIPVTMFPGRSNAILLWLPSENGLVPAEFNAASEIAKSGVEVWLADLHAAYFLPIVPAACSRYRWTMLPGSLLPAPAAAARRFIWSAKVMAPHWH
ncbi:hypothetical protein [Sulfuriferula sp. AH1]|uniref:hypothetical protein n=1 Tax=Sulfuriferula sp. AH1 TaxID=1985873 RepID=UPI0012F72405|nr:hypothetical protein [Sulfuriferula sp. AH1]